MLRFDRITPLLLAGLSLLLLIAAPVQSGQSPQDIHEERQRMEQANADYQYQRSMAAMRFHRGEINYADALKEYGLYSGFVEKLIEHYEEERREMVPRRAPAFTRAVGWIEGSFDGEEFSCPGTRISDQWVITHRTCIVAQQGIRYRPQNIYYTPATRSPEQRGNNRYRVVNSVRLIPPRHGFATWRRHPLEPLRYDIILLQVAFSPNTGNNGQHVSIDSTAQYQLNQSTLVGYVPDGSGRHQLRVEYDCPTTSPAERIEVIGCLLEESDVGSPVFYKRDDGSYAMYGMVMQPQIMGQNLVGYMVAFNNDIRDDIRSVINSRAGESLELNLHWAQQEVTHD